MELHSQRALKTKLGRMSEISSGIEALQSFEKEIKEQREFELRYDFVIERVSTSLAEILSDVR